MTSIVAHASMTARPRSIVHLTAPLTMKWHFCRAKERGLRELIRSNDPVRLSWLQALLADAGIACAVFDVHASVLEGSASAIMRRLVVDEDDWQRARRMLADSGEQLPPADEFGGSA